MQFLKEIRGGEIPHEINGTIQNQVKSWTKIIIFEMYQFKNGIADIIKGNQLLTNPYFVIKSHKQKENVKKNGYNLEQLLAVMGPRLKNVLTFLNPLLNLEKLNTILFKISHPIIVSFTKQGNVNWRVTFFYLISSLAQEKSLYHSRESPLIPCPMQIYRKEECLTKEEKEIFNDKCTLHDYNLNDPQPFIVKQTRSEICIFHVEMQNQKKMKKQQNQRSLWQCQLKRQCLRTKHK